MKITIQSVRFTADSKLVDFIEKRVAKLESFFDRIIEAQVTLRLENTGQVQDKIAEVKLSVPNQVLVAKETSKVFEKSVDGAMDSLKRQLLKHKGKVQNR